MNIKNNDVRISVEYKVAEVYYLPDKLKNKSIAIIRAYIKKMGVTPITSMQFEWVELEGREEINDIKK